MLNLAFASFVFNNWYCFAHLHREYFLNFSIVYKSNGINLPLLSLNFEPICNIKLCIDNDSIIIFIDKKPHFLSLSIFRPNINILLLPINVQSCFYFFIFYCFNYKVCHMINIECNCLSILIIKQPNFFSSSGLFLMNPVSFAIIVLRLLIRVCIILSFHICQQIED